MHLSCLLGCAALGLLAADGADDLVPEAGLAAVGQDDECPDGMLNEGGSCALSLRQLRVAGAKSLAAEVGNQTQIDTPNPDLEDLGGVPGGWGEAATFSDELTENMTLQAQAGWWGGSCASYGCLDYYASWHGCQCNAACVQHHSCCGDYWDKCSHHYAPAPPPPPAGKQVVYKLYHQTSPEAASLIVKNGFRPGTQGWCGGGIYFATSPQATTTKAIGPDSHKGAMLEAMVDVGRVKYMGKYCDRQLDGWKVAGQGYDSVSFDPGDGQEYIIYDKAKVLSVKQVSM